MFVGLARKPTVGRIGIPFMVERHRTLKRPVGQRFVSRDISILNVNCGKGLQPVRGCRAKETENPVRG